ncbi:hypothetical protein PseudUWO311_00300 [Pseudanabaena sp. UWO311]|uniref:hypothetical protein n=1 Tax=Pseudanabaena sp. UWO311 TaxID=2487337 RepID=UPI001158B0B4|nr:hypothetical protein [Pseudanabaena sp. UWO311]TYQ29374.1 hypothetical protein PseudUWO311_00300 [Pseudanabaena sp. UWO311]
MAIRIVMTVRNRWLWADSIILWQVISYTNKKSNPHSWCNCVKESLLKADLRDRYHHQQAIADLC